VGKRRLRGFATLRKQMATEKTHVLAAAALQYLQQFIEERGHRIFCISYGFGARSARCQAL
jgi:hypothetical protein